MLEMDAAAHGAESGAWQVPLAQVIAPQGAGVEDLLDLIERHRAHLLTTGALAVRERERITADLRNHLRDAMLARLAYAIGPDEIDRAVSDVLARSIDPHAAAARLIQRVQFVPRSVSYDGDV
jgi:LAO/AO transport system kinase